MWPDNLLRSTANSSALTGHIERIYHLLKVQELKMENRSSIKLSLKLYLLIKSSDEE